MAVNIAVGNRQGLADQRHRDVGNGFVAGGKIHPFPVVRIKGQALFRSRGVGFERRRIVAVEAHVHNPVAADKRLERGMRQKVF